MVAAMCSQREWDPAVDMTLEEAEAFKVKFSVWSGPHAGEQQIKPLKWFVKNMPEKLEYWMDTGVPGTKKFCAVCVVYNHYLDEIVAGIKQQQAVQLRHQTPSLPGGRIRLKIKQPRLRIEEDTRMVDCEN